MKNISIFGSTGQIGSKSLLIIKKYFPSINITLLVANKNYSIDVEKYILNYWLSQLGYPTTINVVDEISLTKSGKRKFIINESF